MDMDMDIAVVVDAEVDVDVDEDGKEEVLGLFFQCGCEGHSPS